MTNINLIFTVVGGFLLGAYLQKFIRDWLEIKHFKPIKKTQITETEYVSGKVVKLNTPYKTEYFVNPESEEE